MIRWSEKILDNENDALSVIKLSRWSDLGRVDIMPNRIGFFRIFVMVIAGDILR